MLILPEDSMGKGALQAAFDRSLRDPAGFWGDAAEAVYWYKRWEKVLYDSPVTNSIKTFTYRELRDKAATFAGVLTRLGVGKGDRVIVYMPMVPEAAVAMLACARLGAVHSVVFGGFAANELAARIDDAKPKVVVSASCGVEVKRIVPYKPLLDEALRIARHKPKKSVILQRAM